MTPQTGPPGATTKIDLPALDAVAMNYAQRLPLIVEDDDARRAARDQLVAAGLPFASRLAKKYRGRGEPIEDLEQVARLGLLKSVDRYDPERGAFTGFAAVTIIGELRRHFRDRTWGVHVPRRMQELSLEVNRATADLTAQLLRAPTVEELAHRLRIPEEDVLTALESAAAYSTLSLNAPARTDAEADAEMGDLIGTVDGDLEAVDDRVTVSALLCKLPERERRILAMRFYGNRTQSQIATELGISQMHVSRLLSRALTWLREAMLSDAPRYWQAGPVPSDRHELAIEASVDGDLAVLDVAGEVDRDTAGALRDALAAAVRLPVRAIDVRLVRVPLVDANGIGALQAGFEAARAAGIHLRLTDMKPYVARAVKIAGLQNLTD